ncbi:triose-phosphate isomerase [Patescibacteria group bacterium]|nr:triose-phosphate isomerase [Patescibacteria group bacterium]MBU4023439.1 triose-phosphate isomerase [Patescibacteria group bacterium]MBU4078458.1 triose-phosphate isomerase [Patescibacteria group bacterium]
MNPLIIGNWKCNPCDSKKTEKLFSEIKKGLPKKLKAKLVICPPFIYLKDLTGRGLEIGAQDCFFQDGPFTGQISVSMLKSLGCKYVIVGHSEKRAAGEKDKIINLKLKSCLEKRLVPILCIGETLKQRKSNQTSKILRRQLEKDLKGIVKKDIESIVIAYEPVWAIGTGKACDPEIAKVVKMMIKKYLRELYKTDKVKIIYGGSVDAKNALEYAEAGMEGYIIGGMSLKPKEFIAILNNFC